MSQALSLHNALARKLLATHAGYEAATEGDSFTVAFHTAWQALDFARVSQGG